MTDGTGAAGAWICPRCGHVWTIWVAGCDCQPPTTYASDTSLPGRYYACDYPETSIGHTCGLKDKAEQEKAREEREEVGVENGGWFGSTVLWWRRAKETKGERPLPFLAGCGLLLVGVPLMLALMAAFVRALDLMFGPWPANFVLVFAGVPLAVACFLVVGWYLGCKDHKPWL